MSVEIRSLMNPSIFSDMREICSPPAWGRTANKIIAAVDAILFPPRGGMD